MKLELSKNKLDLFIKTALWNSIIEVFQTEKSINFSKYLVSINVRWNKFIVKTWNPIINAELLIFDEKIKEIFKEKIKNLQVDFGDFEVMYK